MSTALDLFSTQGYEAASVLEIAEAFGIRKASLYSHFASKREILDSLMQSVREEYEKRSIFAHADWEDSHFTKDKQDLTAETAILVIIGQIRYILHDRMIYKVRKMLAIEQFQNPQMAQVQTKRNYADVMGCFTGLVRFLVRQGELDDDATEIMAAQLCLPISVWINLCDREPERESEVLGLIEWHVRQSFKIYRPK